MTPELEAYGPAAFQLRNAFDSRPSKRIMVTYDALLRAFSERTCNMARIARNLGVTPKAVGDLYRRYFQPVIGKTARELLRGRRNLAPEQMTEKELRSEYDRMLGTRTRVNLTYDELLALFQEPERDFAAIGRKLGIRRETVWSYYNRYYKPILGLSGKERFFGSKLRRRDELIREIPEKGGVLGAVARAAEKAGRTVRRTPKIGQSFGLRDFGLLIDDNLCRIHHLRAKRSAPRTTQRYVRATIHRTRKVPYVAHILYVQISKYERRILVVPTYVLNRLTGRGGKVELHIPVEQRPVYHNNAPRVNWFNYVDAWHLLEGDDI